MKTIDQDTLASLIARAVAGIGIRPEAVSVLPLAVERAADKVGMTALDMAKAMVDNRALASYIIGIAETVAV